MYVSGHFLGNIYWLLAWTRYAPRSSGDERIFFSKWSLNIIANFMEWNLTDSDEILETLILTRRLNFVQISWRLASLLQNHSRKSRSLCTPMHAKVMAVFRHKNQLYASIQFAYILIEVSGICSWSILVNHKVIKPTVLDAAIAWTDISEILKITLTWFRWINS